jgi:hypothetical protein
MAAAWIGVFTKAEFFCSFWLRPQMGDFLFRKAGQSFNSRVRDCPRCRLKGYFIATDWQALFKCRSPQNESGLLAVLAVLIRNVFAA